MNHWQAEKDIHYSFLPSPQPLKAKDMSQEEALKIIQVAERARQGRLRAKLNEESRKMNRMYSTKDSGTADTELASVCIQKVLVINIIPHAIFSPSLFGLCHFTLLKDLVWCDLQVWRGYIQRKRAKIARDEEMIFLGMVSTVGH